MRPGERVGKWCLASVLAIGVSPLLVAAAPALGQAGFPDPSFGSGGFTIVDDPVDVNESLADVLVQPDGSLIAAGNRSGSSGILLARFNSSGVLDPTFGNGGLAVQPDTGVVGAPRNLSGIEYDFQGRIVGAGLGRGPAANAAGFARYLPTGAPDPAFSDDGLNVILCSVGSCTLGDVAPTPDGGVVGVGSTPVIDQAVVVKLLENGNPDLGFDGDGVRYVNVPGAAESGRAIEVLGDGSIMIAGDADDGVFLAHLSSTGTLIGGFGTGGIATELIGLDPGPTDAINDIELLPDGRIIAVGRADDVGDDDPLFAARFSATGDLDPAFAGGGVLRRSPGPRDDVATALALDSAGRIVVLGATGGADDGTGDFWIARLSSEGVLDPTYGTAGETVAGFIPQSDDPAGLTLQPDGAAIAVGRANLPAGGQLEIARFTGDPATPSGNCKGKAATLSAAPAGGKLAGTPGKDVIVGSDAADKINSGAGDDLICAGKGKDKLKGGAGKDGLIGEAGKDRLSGGGGKDRLVGGPGKDGLNGGGGKDRCKGGPGRDTEKSC